MHLTKWGLAWTRVLSRLSSLVWKSCVNVEIGSSPFNLEKVITIVSHNLSLDILARAIVLLQVGVRGRRYPEADTPGHRVARVQGLQLAAEQMCGETEAARVLVEHGHQVVRDHVLVRVFFFFFFGQREQNFTFSNKTQRLCNIRGDRG